MVRERQSGRSLAFLGACGPAPRRTQARRATARVSFLIHGPHATRRGMRSRKSNAGRVPRPNVFPHGSRPSPGTPLSHKRQPTPSRAWVRPNHHARAPSLHTAKTATKPTTVTSSRLPFFSAYLARRRPARRRPGSASHTRRRARACSGDRVPEALVQEFIETTGGSVKGSAASLLAGISGTASGSCTVGPSPRHQKTGRASRIQLLLSTFASTVQTSTVDVL